MIPILLYASAVPTFAAVKDNVLFIALLAMLLDGVIIVIWYAFGVLLNNSGIKASAIGETGQLIGTGVIIALILVSLTTFSLVFYSSLNTTGGLMSPSVLQTQCTNMENANSNPSNGLTLLSPTDSVLAGPSTSTAFPYFPGLCNMLSYGPTTSSSGAVSYGLDSQTFQMDYPLVATGLELANMTNQTATNLNQSFTLDSFIGFLRQLNLQLNLCFNFCFTLTPVVIQAIQTPFAGFTLISNGLQLIGNLLAFSLESYTAQLLFVIIGIFIWPYLIFIGIILRVTPFTRKLGGLFIAIAISIIMVFPAVFAIQYLSLGNGLPSSFLSTYGATNQLISPLSKYVFPSGVQYPDYTKYPELLNFIHIYAIQPLESADIIDYPPNINFYIEPKVITIGETYECYPIVNTEGTIHGLQYVETWDLTFTLVPFIGSYSSILNLFYQFFEGTPYAYALPYTCLPNNAVLMLFALLEAYGEIAVTAYILPILNVIILVVSIRGLSGLMGGDTSLAGLSRLI